MGRGSFESRLFNNIDSNTQDKPESVKKDRRESKDSLDTVLSHFSAERVNMDEFKDVFGEKEVENDKKLVRGIQSRFERQLENLTDEERKSIEYRHRRAEALEVIITDHAERDEWFGSGVYTQRASLYDDYVNGVDVVVEFDAADGAQRLAMAVDASMNNDPTIVRKKVNRNFDKFTGQQESPMVKYFESQIDGKKGQIKALPIVVGLETENARELIDLAAKIAHFSQEAKANQKVRNSLKAAKQEMVRHPAQKIFLLEIEQQLSAYYNYLQKGGQASFQPQEIKGILTTVRKVLDEKTSIDDRLLQNDQVFTFIQEGITTRSGEILSGKKRG